MHHTMHALDAPEDRPLEWLCSFLSEHINCTVFGSSRSVWVSTPFSVPQGSVLGPLQMHYLHVRHGEHTDYWNSCMLITCRPTGWPTLTASRPCCDC